MRHGALPGALLLALLVAGCTSPAAQEGPRVLATFYPVGFFAERIAGDNLSVGTLIAPGVEPHEWDPAPRDRAALEDAALFIYNGGGLEPWAEDIIGSLSASRGPLIVDASEGIAAAQMEDEEEPGAQVTDPHFWLDPVRAQGMARNILAGLQRADPANATAFQERHEALAAQLAELDGDFQRGLADCANRHIVTTHAAFGYVAQRYNFTQHSISGVSPEAEPPPAHVRDMVELVKRLNVTHVFFETLVSPRVAEVIAEQAGAQTLVLDPAEGVPADAPPGTNYFTLLRTNLDHLRIAMRCR